MEKFLLLAGIGREMYGRWQIRRMASVLVTVLILAVTAAVMVGILVVGSMYTFYLFLLGQGLDPQSALFAIILTAVGITGLLLVAIRQSVLQLRSSVTTPMRETVDAFFDGLLSR